MSVWTKVKAWWDVYITGIVTSPQEPVDTMTLEEALEKFGANDDEWEEE